jgi:hypothetical protein
VVVPGGTVAIADAVVAEISGATGLAVAVIATTPSKGIVRVAGADRTQTAERIADLFTAYHPAFLPADGKAHDADLLDGHDSTDFVTTDATLRLWHDRQDVVLNTTTTGLQNVQTLDVDVPAAGFLHVTASIEIQNNPTTELANLLIRVDTSGAATLPGPGFTQRIAAADDNKASLATHTQSFVIPVDAGSYTLTVKVGDNSPPIDYDVGDRTLTAVWYPDSVSDVSLP